MAYDVTNKIVHQTTVDIGNTRSVPQLLKITQGDTSYPVLAIKIVNGGKYYQIPEGSMVSLSALKPDGFKVFISAAGISDDRTIAYFEPTDQMTAAVGKITAVVQVAVPDGVGGTGVFVIDVNANPGSDPIVSANDLSAFNDIKNQAIQASAGMAKYQSDVQNAVSTAQSAQQTANLTDSRLDTLIVNGQQTEGNTELIDIRTGFNGTTHETAGDAVRGQYENLDILKEDSEFEKSSEEIYDEKANGLINHDNGKIDFSGNSGYVYKKKSVSLGDILIITGRTYNYNSNYSAITFTDSENNVIGTYPIGRVESGGDVTNDKLVIISNNRIKYVYANGSNDNECKIYTAVKVNILKSDLKKWDKELEQNFNELDITKANWILEKESDTESFDSQESGLINHNSSNIDLSENSFYKHKIKTVTFGDKFIVSGRSYNYNYDYSLITYLDANDKVIDYYPKGKNDSEILTETNVEVFITNNLINKIVINGDTSLCSIYSAKNIDIKELRDDVDNIEISLNNKSDKSYLTDFIQMADMVKRIRSGCKSFNWKSFDGGYMTIIFDDGRHDLNKVKDICKEYEIPFCAAIPTESLNSLTDDGSKIIDVAKEIVSNGGEILSHGVTSTVLKDPNDYDLLKQMLMDSKQTLTENGFEIRGFITPGGTGAIDWNGNNVQRFTQLFYDYGDLCGDDPQYRKGRVSLGYNDISVAKGYVDDAINHSKWYTFMSHTLDGSEQQLTEEWFREFIEYALSKGIKFKTYAFMYDNFGNYE